MTGYIKIEGNEGYIYNVGADIHEVKNLSETNKDCLRVYKSHPNGLTVQIRAYCPIIPKYENPDAKPRNMIASISLSEEELDAFYSHAKRLFNE